MGLLILGIVTIGFVIGFVTAFWLTCWVLRSRAKQHGMQAELKRLLSKPIWNKKIGGITKDGPITWTNCGRPPL